MAKITNELTTLQRAKDFLEITSSTKDTILTREVIKASQFAKKYCNRDFRYQAYSNQQYDGTGSIKLLLKQYPVDSSASFSLQQRAPSWSDNLNGDWQTIDTDQYIVDYEKGIIKMVSGFVEGILNYRVSYTAGFYLPSHANFDDDTDDNMDLPYDLEGAVLDLISYGFYSRKNKGVASERVRDISVTYLKAAQRDEEIKRVLDYYKRPIIRSK